MLQEIKQTLENAFPEADIHIFNDSDKHAHHAQNTAKPGDVSHVRLEIKDKSLMLLNRIDAHRKINACLNAYFERGLHALQIHIKNK